MISALFLISQKGEVVLNRFYRDDVSRRAADNFRLQVIAAKETGTLPPVKVIDGCSFLYTRHENLYLVAVSRANINAALGLPVLLPAQHHLPRIFRQKIQ
ncbi:uncharacterized protein PITG_17478 [Phytophthora infestans T30-4]|uniref:Coatomer subunit zeta n=1 Tax=Phytophthora infestans (strain T30-4) TaxID=403677 RepID=D0NWD2_PHYIT|nr:uncharacterized protein PITG_17478 [Phytophthora infestans T30-4]EEY66988.1 conserved hypothetical protein [Phytophthora infestans T30-4]|eukprot:XP_002896542.1 conserved hypothetical protein [Phytophthora infestans T30-4]